MTGPADRPVPLWPAGAATGIGSMPGTDAAEAARTVVGELPDVPHVPELPGRGLGADIIGRGAALLVDVAIEEVTSGYRVTARPGRDHRRAVSLLRGDLDALDEALGAAGATPALVKVQAPGPFTLAAGIELRNGHRVLTDHGAVREFAQSLGEGLARHVAEVAARTGARVVAQLDEPGLPAVLGGRLPTPSGYGTVPAVPEADAEATLRAVIEAVGVPVVAHCCAPRAPIALLRRAGAAALALDAGLVAAEAADTATLDVLGETWDAGTVLVLGLVPPLQPAAPPTLRDLADPALALADKLGFARASLAERVVAAPACGLAGATPRWARRALTLARDLGRAFVDPPSGW